MGIMISHLAILYEINAMDTQYFLYSLVFFFFMIEENLSKINCYSTKKFKSHSFGYILFMAL